MPFGPGPPGDPSAQQNSQFSHYQGDQSMTTQIDSQGKRTEQKMYMYRKSQSNGGNSAIPEQSAEHQRESPERTEIPQIPAQDMMDDDE
jgi:hypothetical protein